MGIWRIGKNAYSYHLPCIVSSFILGRICHNRCFVKSLPVAVYSSADRSGIVCIGSSPLLYPDSDTGRSEGFYGWYSCDSAGIDGFAAFLIYSQVGEILTLNQSNLNREVLVQKIKAFRLLDDDFMSKYTEYKLSGVLESR